VYHGDHVKLFSEKSSLQTLKAMKNTIFQVIILLLFISLCLSGFLLVRHILQLPFSSTNDALHKRGSAFNLDYFIPSGTYLDQKITIGEVVKLRINKERSFYERVLRGFSDLIPGRYRYMADLFLFFFWFLCFMTFFRVFTFMGYGKALRGSLLLGGVVYYFMPDFSAGKSDDIAIIGLPVFIILLRIFIRRRRKRNKQQIFET
jgi:hypothetical protein